MNENKDSVPSLPIEPMRPGKSDIEDIVKHAEEVRMSLIPAGGVPAMVPPRRVTANEAALNARREANARKWEHRARRAARGEYHR